MAGSYTDFLKARCVEFVEEASFLYEQRLAMIGDAEVGWRDLDDFERRLDAHLDGLLVAGDVAVPVCQEHAASGDPGNLYAAIAFACRAQNRGLLAQILAVIDGEETGLADAVARGLAFNAPAAWRPALSDLLPAECTGRMSILARVSGYLRLTPTAELLLAADNDHEALATVLWAFGRIPDAALRAPLWKHLRHDDASLRAVAALALLRKGDRQTLQECTRQAAEHSLSPIPLALAGGRQIGHTLITRMRGATDVSGEDLQAAGLLGDVSVVEPLVECMAVEGLSADAALALQILTGAGLHEEVFIADDIEPDEIGEDQYYRAGEDGTVRRADGGPAGTTQIRLCEDATIWRQWWHEHASKFPAQYRYRSGRPVTPRVLLADLRAGATPHSLRQWTYEELVIRYGLGEPFEADMLVADQLRALARMESWLHDVESGTKAGAWYFEGRELG